MKSKIVSTLAVLITLCLPAFAVTYDYDAIGRLVKVDYGDGRAIEYTYDASGNRTSVVVDTNAPVTEPAPPPSTQEFTIVPLGSSFILIPKEE